MAKIATLSPDELLIVEKAEAELNSNGGNKMLVAYSDEYARLSQSQVELVQGFEAALKEQGADVVLLAYNK